MAKQSTEDEKLGPAYESLRIRRSKAKVTGKSSEFSHAFVPEMVLRTFHENLCHHGTGV